MPSPEALARIERIGRMRAPREACGVLLRDSVHELVNRATENDQADMDFAELVELVQRIDPDLLLSDLVVWHTHPGGHVGPSQQDMSSRGAMKDFRLLVVALTDHGAIATHY